jgi:hypothetical protein
MEGLKLYSFKLGTYEVVAIAKSRDEAIVWLVESFNLARVTEPWEISHTIAAAEKFRVALKNSRCKTMHLKRGTCVLPLDVYVTWSL